MVQHRHQLFKINNVFSVKTVNALLCFVLYSAFAFYIVAKRYNTFIFKVMVYSLNYVTLTFPNSSSVPQFNTNLHLHKVSAVMVASCCEVI